MKIRKGTCPGGSVWAQMWPVHCRIPLTGAYDREGCGFAPCSIVLFCVNNQWVLQEKRIFAPLRYPVFRKKVVLSMAKSGAFPPETGLVNTLTAMHVRQLGMFMAAETKFIDMSNSVIRDRVEALLKWMKEEHFEAFIVPTIDPHNSEYTPVHWNVREWLTGFSGSAGTAVVCSGGEAALWTDSRYFLQAEEQLKDPPFVLMRDGLSGTSTVAEWLKGILPGGTVGYYGEMMTPELRNDLLSGLPDTFHCRTGETDPFRSIWADRPELPCAPLEIMPVSLAGTTAEEKLRHVFDVTHRECPYARYVMLNDLSEIAWALNLRGSDIEYNPVFMSYLIVGEHRALLCTDERRLTSEVKEYLDSIGVATACYYGWKDFMAEAGPEAVIALPATMNLSVISHCEACGVPYRMVPWHVPELRAVKTAEEQDGFRKAMERDGAAMVRFLRWLPEAVAKGGQTEYTIAEKLSELRTEESGFCGLSFATIAGYGPHGAIVHYEAAADSAAELRLEGLLLLDSGAQYDSGTTDITRTVALGPVTDEEKRVYTLVLKGHIALSRCRFPEGTTGIQLDLAARYAMWQEGYDFGHGTGHGVGHRLCVHEGPHQIRKNLRGCTVIPFRPGMTITNEPGIYVAGRFGVRIENTLLTVPAGTTDFGTFLAFEPLTLCPIDLKPVEISLLTAAERQWLNDYHATVRARLLPCLKDEADAEWLKTATLPI